MVIELPAFPPSQHFRGGDSRGGEFPNFFYCTPLFFFFLITHVLEFLIKKPPVILCYVSALCTLPPLSIKLLMYSLFNRPKIAQSPYFLRFFCPLYGFGVFPYRMFPPSLDTV